MLLYNKFVLDGKFFLKEMIFWNIFIFYLKTAGS